MKSFWQDLVEGIGSTTTDSRGNVHTTTTQRIYDPSKDPWRPVRNLLTCPHCGLIGRHREWGDPQKEYQTLLDRQLEHPSKCGSCGAWSVAGRILLNGKRYELGQRVVCPEYLIPRRKPGPEEER